MIYIYNHLRYEIILCYLFKNSLQKIEIKFMKSKKNFVTKRFMYINLDV